MNNAEKDGKDRNYYLLVLKKIVYRIILFASILIFYRATKRVLEGRTDFRDESMIIVSTAIIIEIMVLVPMLRKNYLKKLESRKKILYEKKNKIPSNCSMTIDEFLKYQQEIKVI